MYKHDFSVYFVWRIPCIHHNWKHHNVFRLLGLHILHRDCWLHCQQYSCWELHLNYLRKGKNSICSYGQDFQQRPHDQFIPKLRDFRVFSLLIDTYYLFTTVYVSGCHSDEHFQIDRVRLAEFMKLTTEIILFQTLSNWKGLTIEA